MDISCLVKRSLILLQGTGTSFALSGNGDDVYLFSGNGAGNLTGYSHGWSFAGAGHLTSPLVRYVHERRGRALPEANQPDVHLVPSTNSGPSVGPLVVNRGDVSPLRGLR
jgi:hypothetical protein